MELPIWLMYISLFCVSGLPACNMCVSVSTSPYHLFFCRSWRCNCIFKPSVFLIYYFSYCIERFLFFCQANGLAPVYLRRVNILFLFWALIQPIVLPEIKHLGFFNIIFFISPGSIFYLYSLSTFLCCFISYIIIFAIFRKIPYFCHLCLTLYFLWQTLGAWLEILQSLSGYLIMWSKR